MGLKIVQSLATQINGKFGMEERDGGTICRLTFQA